LLNRLRGGYVASDMREAAQKMREAITALARNSEVESAKAVEQGWTIVALRQEIAALKEQLNPRQEGS